MRKILIVITTSFVPYGGLTTVMMNYYRAMNKEGLQIDFASTNEIPKILLEELESNGSSYYCLGNRKGKLLNYLKHLSKLLKCEKYDVIHVNGNSATMAFELLAAKWLNVPLRIAHGHTTQSGYPALHKVLHPVFQMSYDCALAVSNQVGEWLYAGNNYAVWNNAIDVAKYQYKDSDTRDRCRESLQLNDAFVVGHIGKMNSSKNHSFLLQVFAELRRINENAHLLLVGDGELRREIERQCEALGIVASVSFIGMKDAVVEYLHAMDVFAFPSSFEGLGLALIEAQAAGLSCVASDVVPVETKVTDNVTYLSLKKSPKEWAEELMKGNKDSNRVEKSLKACKSIEENGYSVSCQAYRLEKIYRGI